MQRLPAHLIGDILDRAVLLCRTHARTILSQLLVVQCINLALLSLLYPWLGLTPSSAGLWRLPFYVGNPFTLFDAAFFARRSLDPAFAPYWSAMSWLSSLACGSCLSHY